MNIEFEVGGGGAIGGLIIGSVFASLTAAAVSLTLAANVCETTVVADIEEVGTADLGGALPVDIMIALVYDMVVFVVDDGIDAGEMVATLVVIITWLGFLSTVCGKH